MTPPRHLRSRRAGQGLLIVFLLILAIAGVLALTLDFGFVLLSRRSMQSAVNTAALEGARDVDNQGRQNAQTLIQNVFDDNLDASSNPTTLGAGPDNSLVQRDGLDQPILGNGSGSLNLLENRSSFIYRPSPELNLGNETHGDFLRGDYAADPDEIGSMLPPHTENNEYDRSDFLVNDDGRSFLARLRRTSERQGIANPLDRDAGVSSSGGGSPLLVGHLAMFTSMPAGSFDIRRDGVAIRATAIADLRAIVSVGSAISPAVFSTIRFGFSADDSQWYELTETTQSLGEPVTIIDQDPSDPDIDPVDIAAIPDAEAIGYAPVSCMAIC